MIPSIGFFILRKINGDFSQLLWIRKIQLLKENVRLFQCFLEKILIYDFKVGVRDIK